MEGREKLAAVFAGERVAKVPFALKGWRIPQCEDERALRNRGLCILDSRPVYSVASPHTSCETREFTRDGASYRRTVIQTPRGPLSSLVKQVPSPRSESTSWREEMLFKGPDDYAALEFMLRDRQFAPAYESFLLAQDRVGADAYFKTVAPGAPLHDIMYGLMGLETFSIEWVERRDEIMKLHDALAANLREIYLIVSRSPAKVVGSGGNYSPEVLGMERFQQFVLPHWEEIAAILRAGGKMLGSHLDANNRLWAEAVASSPLDWIEAFTPAPDTDMSLAEARRLWRDKVLFINFPSSLHLEERDIVEAETTRLLGEAAPGDRFIIGITENVPENRWRQSFAAILDAIDRDGNLPIKGAS